MTAIVVGTEALDRLLDPADAALRARVLVDLLDRTADDPEVVEARARIPGQPWVAATLAAHHGDGTWGRGFYTKYDGTSWVLLHLSEVGAPMDHPAIRAGVERLLTTARRVADLRGVLAEPFRGCPDGVVWELPVVCLSAHMALVLIRAGLADHPVTRGALAVCRHRFVPGEGFGCFAVAESLLPACVMAVPKVLKALLALPSAARTPDDEAFVRDLVALLRRFDLMDYVPRDARAWRAWAATVTPAERRAAKAAWAAAGRLEPRRAKEGWLRFSFPHSYNSDLLEVLLLLGEAGAEREAVVEGGLRKLLAARGADGMWRAQAGLHGKMHADLDVAGQPSPWITYRALLALRRFGALAWDDGSAARAADPRPVVPARPAARAPTAAPPPGTRTPR